MPTRRPLTLALIPVIFVWALAPASGADPTLNPQSPLDPQQLMHKSAEACRQIRTIEYTEEQFHGPNETLPEVVATVRQARAGVPSTGFLPGKFVVQGQINRPGSGAQRFAYSYDGASLRLLDPAEKVVRVVKSPTPGVTGSLLAAYGLIGIPPFTEDRPFQTILERAERFVYGGTRAVQGVVCHVVEITQVIDHPSRGKQTSMMRWFIGRDDHLPRGNEIGAMRKLIRITRVDGAADAESYAIATPPGYGEKLITGRESRTSGLLGTGSPAPEWTLRDADGRAHSLKDYRGRVVLLDFWGTWCIPCLKTMPTIQKLHEKFSDRGLVVFGIAVADNEGDPVGHMKRNRFTYGLLLNGDEVAALYRAEILPALYVIGPDGRIIHAEYGFRENALAELSELIEKSLAK